VDATVLTFRRQRFEIAAGIAYGMQFIHDHGFVHCDLKPGNILLTMVRQGGIVMPWPARLPLFRMDVCLACACMWVVSRPAALLQEGDRLVSKVSDMGLALRLPVAAMQVDAAASKLWYVPGEVPVATARGRFVHHIHLVYVCR
jgi:serine/threonine protein kinase